MTAPCIRGHASLTAANSASWPLLICKPLATSHSTLQRLCVPVQPVVNTHCRTKTSLRIFYDACVRSSQGTTLLDARYPSPAPFRTMSTAHSPCRPPAESRQQPPSHDIIFSVNQPADLPDRVSRLLPAWQLIASKKGIIRHFTFSTFTKAWRFMSLVADECKVKNHHPSWSNLYNQVTIEWTTHRPEGLSIKDVEMAEFCNQKAAEIGLKE